MSDPTTLVRLKRRTLRRLRSHGKFGETWDEVVSKVLDKFDEARRGRR